MMHRGRTALFFALVLAAMPAAAQVAPRYPETRRDAVVEDHFGQAVADPYRWLEGNPRTDPAVAQWVAAQNALTRRYLDAIPGRAAVKRHLATVWNFEKRTPPRIRGGRSFFEHNSGLQNQNVIMVREGARDRVLVDPNRLSATGSVVVHDWKPSRDGTKLLYATQANGGDVRRLHIVDVASGRDEELPLDGLRTPAFDWSADGGTLFYARYPNAGTMAAAAPSAIYAHRIGTAQADDVRLIADPSGGKLILWPRPTEDGRLLVEIGTTDGTRADIVLIDPRAPAAAPRPLTSGMQGSWRFVAARGDKAYFVTTMGAPRGRVVALDLTRGADQVPVEIAPSPPGAIQQAVLAGDELVVRSLDGLRSHLLRYGLDGRARGEVALPPLTIVSALEGAPDRPEIAYTLSSMVMAPTLYAFDARTAQTRVLERPRTSWNPADFTLRQIEARSSDGTMIPVTLAYRKTAKPAPRPTVLMVYGGWGLSVDVAFTESRFAWMDMGGVFAIAHIRGGGERGEDWHRAAIKEGHLKGIADYAAAARTLQALRITTPAQTIAYGSSNGGMMTTATIDKYPQLFGVAIPRVAVTDLVRFPLFTSGPTWIGEMGNPADRADFAGLMKWSPLHNVPVRGPFPAVLANTSLGDDRVVPLHSFKYVATLQANDLGPRPRVLRIELDAGHGDGKSVSQLVDEFTDLWSFAAHESGLAIR